MKIERPTRFAWASFASFVLCVRQRVRSRQGQQGPEAQQQQAKVAMRLIIMNSCGGL